MYNIIVMYITDGLIINKHDMGWQKIVGESKLIELRAP